MWTHVILMLLASDIGYGLPTQGREVSDLYSVHQDRPGTRLLMMNPRPERPTLRDITYYHVVETAYPNPEGGYAAEVETERAFTNAHGQGYEFIDILPIALPKEDAINDDDTDTSDEADSPTDDEITYYDDEETTQDDDNKTDVPGEANSPDESGTDVDTANDDDVTEIDGDVEDDDAQETLDDAGSTTEASTVTNGTVAVNDDVATERIATEKNPTTTDNIHRHQQQLFSSPEKLKERYLKMKNFIPNVRKQAVMKERRKRSVLDTTEPKEIPEAPMLGEIDYDSLPKYIRAMISTEKPNTKQPVVEVIEKKNHSYETEHEKHRNSIKNKMEHVFSNLKTKEVEFEDVLKDLALDNQEDGVVNIKTDQVRTYGMNMSDDHGIVWNNLWSNPGMYHNVGEQAVEDPINMEEKKEVSSPEKPPYVNKPATFKPDTEIQAGHNNPTEIENTKPEIDDASNDIFVNVNKDKVKDKPVALSTVSSLNLDENDESIKNTDAAPHIPVDLKPLVDEKDERIPESLSKLIEDDQFWNWLTDWTAAYAELLIEHVGNAVKEEIEKQMSNNTMPIIQELYPAVESAKKPDEKLKNSETGIKDDNKNITIDELETEEDVKESKGGRKIIFTDEGEVVLEITPDDDEDEQEDLLRRRKNKDKIDITDDKKPDASTEMSVNKKGEKIIANNIYGNAVGNEKVTNIFIFTPSNETDMLLQKLYLLTHENGDLNTNSVVIDNRFSDVHDKENATQIETEANIKNSTTSGNKSDDLKPSIEKEENKNANLLSETEVSDKSREQTDVNDKSDNTELSDDHEKEIEEIKLTHKTEIEKLVTEHKKEIEKLVSEHQKEMEKEKLKNSDDSNVNSKETDHAKESTSTNGKDDIKKTENSKNFTEKVIEKLMSDNQKEIEKLKRDHKKHLEELKKQYEEEIDKIKSEHNKENKNSDIENNKEYSKPGNNDKESEKLETEEKVVNDETKESESNNKKDTEKNEKEEKKEIESSGKDEKDIKSHVSATEKDTTSTTEADKEK